MSDNLRDVSVEQYYNLLKTVNNPLVIMGTPGLCKTSLPAQVAADVGGTSHVIPVAQFSEPGDMLGCPFDIEVETDDGLKRKTAYATPDYFPTKGKGFIVIDDFNRANSLIIQSLLHLAQYREFGSYKVPELEFDNKGNWVSGFKLVFTGNLSDEENDYIVNEVDNAFYSRVICFKLKFDKIMWGRWARKAGINEKFISFMLKNSSEYVTANDNPRAWSNGFIELGDTEDLDLIDLIMSGCVSAHFNLKTWLEKEWTTLNFDSADVFDTKKHEGLMKIFDETGNDGKTLFAERIATLNVTDLSKTHQTALKKFFHLLLEADQERMMMAFIPLNKECPTFHDDKLFSTLV